MTDSLVLPESASLWVDQRVRPATGFGGELAASASVVVIGAGICGLATAAMLADHGVDVVVLEAGDGAIGVSAQSSAKVSVLHQLTAAGIAEQRGEQVAADYIAANRFGVDWIRRYVEERAVDCSWESRDAITYVNEASSVASLESEAALYRRAGVDVVLDGPLDVPFEARRSITAPGQYQFDPVAFLDTVAENLVTDGHDIVYGARVHRIKQRRNVVTVQSSAGDIDAGHVIVTTGLPFLDRGLFFARTEPQSSYIVACEVEAPPAPGMYLAADGTKRSIRSATTGDGIDVLLVGGEGHKTGQGGDTEQRYATLAAWTNDHFGVRQVTHRFMAQDYMTGDSIPFAGPVTPGNDRVLVATGMNKWGFSNGPAASAVNVASIVDGAPPSWTKSFSSSRIPVSGAKTIIKANANVAAHLVGGWAAALTKTHDPKPGQGHVQFDKLRPVAVCADSSDGTLTGVDGKCPHLGASLVWNPAEKTWDCPLHGSRFEADGRLLHGPAVDDLARRATG